MMELTTTDWEGIVKGLISSIIILSLACGFFVLLIMVPAVMDALADVYGENRAFIIGLILIFYCIFIIIIINNQKEKE